MRGLERREEREMCWVYLKQVLVTALAALSTPGLLLPHTCVFTEITSPSITRENLLNAF